jgi:hypothetical protein
MSVVSHSFDLFSVAMKKLFTVLFIAGLLFLLTGCPYGYKYPDGRFPESPANLSLVNSMYDDYNMSAPIIGGKRYLYFSSNRNSFGEDFDIVGNHFHVWWNKDEGVLHVDDREHWNDYGYTDTLFDRMNDGNNQYGPYSLPYYLYEELQSNYNDVLIYTDDGPGDLDIKFVSFHNDEENPGPGSGTYYGPDDISFLNTSFNDAYLTFWGQKFIFWEYGVDISAIREGYFCSDRDGDYDIFSFDYPADSDMVEFLQSDTVSGIAPVDILNSESQDKCPYIDGTLLVFTSDRPGGYGGFDIYYSLRQGNTWSAPVNFGKRINSEYNEYRPVVMLFTEFSEDLLLFSSDRPGGEGGYDLYYVGIPRMIQ